MGYNDLILISLFMLIGGLLVIAIPKCNTSETLDEILYDDYERDKDDKGTL